VTGEAGASVVHTSAIVLLNSSMILSLAFGPSEGVASLSVTQRRAGDIVWIEDEGCLELQGTLKELRYLHDTLSVIYTEHLKS